VERSPAFSCYAAQTLAETGHLSLEEAGAFFRLWLNAWLGHDDLEQGHLPNDEEALANMLGSGVGRWPKVKEKVLKRFPGAGDGTLHHPGLVASRAKQRARAVSGAAGGSATAAARRGDGGKTAANGDQTGQQEGQQISSDGAAAEPPDLHQNDSDGAATGPAKRRQNGSKLPANVAAKTQLPVPIPAPFQIDTSSEGSLPSGGSGNGERGVPAAAAAAAGRAGLLVEIQLTLRTLAVRRPLSARERAQVQEWEASGCPAEVVLRSMREIALREYVGGRSIGSFRYFESAIAEAVAAWREHPDLATVDVGGDLAGYRGFVLHGLSNGQWEGVNAAALERARKAVRRACSCREIEVAVGALPVPAGSAAAEDLE